MKPYADQMVQSDSMLSRTERWNITPFMTKVTDLHFDQKNPWETTGSGDMKYLAIFSAVALLILLIACINYMNLATARSARRAKEVGLRKSLGSKRREIAGQFFYESSLMTFGSLVLRPALAELNPTLRNFSASCSARSTISSIISGDRCGIRSRSPARPRSSRC